MVEPGNSTSVPGKLTSGNSRSVDASTEKSSSQDDGKSFHTRIEAPNRSACNCMDRCTQRITSCRFTPGRMPTMPSSLHGEPMNSVRW
ncbi:hypothetical protein GALL_314860 [mine drainage metagenome]|uniref:Uncharacterized protein n=1 Tax=mine drainage metagenome TaxID=410659 RepID=A0A1J5QTG9_9ZZZZ